MYLKSCCALFLLALVACQAAPSSKVIEKKSISEAEATFAKKDIKLEDSGAEKDRAKKSATTFCVEVRSGKPEQVPCRQQIKPQEVHQDKPVVFLQPITVPAPAPVEYSKQQPFVIQHPQMQQQPQFQPQPQLPQGISLFQQQQTFQPAPQQIHQVAPPAPAPVQVPAPVQAPAPAPIPIINIVPAAPAPAPCDKPTIVQHSQPQQIHTVHVIHPQLQPTPSVTVIPQEVKPKKEEKPAPRPVHIKPPPVSQQLPMPKQEITFRPFAPPSCKTDVVVAPPHSMEFIVPRPTSFVRVQPQYIQPVVKPQEEAYECNCRPENRIPTLTPYVTSRFPKIQEAHAIPYPGGRSFESMPYRSSMISMDDPSIMPEQPIFFTSEGAGEAEGRHHKKKYEKYAPPLQLSVQFPIYGADNSPKYYQPYPPSYINPYSQSPYTNSYGTYPSSYGTYGNYETSYPVGYDSQASASNVPSITVNAGGPFYRESQHIDASPQPNDGAQPREALSTTTEIIDGSNNQKREANLIPLPNEQNEITEGREKH